MKPFVVLPPLVVVRQDLVGLLYFLEAFLGSGVFGVGIRVVLANEPTVRSLDIVRGSLFSQPEQLIQIFVVHL